MDQSSRLTIIEQLEFNRIMFESLLRDVKPEMYNWRQSDDKWSLLEILCHLFDEEREDFRTRLKLVLEDPEKDPPKIDPQGWVKSREYASWNYDETLNKFLNERDQSIDWLKSLTDKNWQQAYQHLHFGPMSGDLFLSNWLAHDYLHIRQITKFKFDYLGAISGEDLTYAGDW